MKPFRLALLLLSGMLLASPAFGQYSSVSIPADSTSHSQTVNIPSSSVCEILAFSALGQGASSASVSVGSVAVATGGTTSQPRSLIVPGPATLTISVGPGTSTFLSYRLFDNTSGVGQGIPSSAVVIPADASGPVQIILESTTDMVTWTPANPGTYGASTSKRFFRVRAVQQ